MNKFPVDKSTEAVWDVIVNVLTPPAIDPLYVQLPLYLNLILPCPSAKIMLFDKLEDKPVTLAPNIVL